MDYVLSSRITDLLRLELRTMIFSGICSTTDELPVLFGQIDLSCQIVDSLTIYSIYNVILGNFLIMISGHKVVPSHGKKHTQFFVTEKITQISLLLFVILYQILRKFQNLLKVNKAPLFYLPSSSKHFQ